MHKEYKKERSRAYPFLDLEAAYHLILGSLFDLDQERLSRKMLADKLGYSNGDGGIGARKIAALVHYGLMERDARGYGLSARSLHLLDLPPSSADCLRVLRGALEQPVLFRSVLERYRPLGKVPGDLAPVLSLEYGITKGASVDAANVFRRSARFAGVLAEDGSFFDLPRPGEFVATPLPGRRSERASTSPPPDVRRIEILLPDWRHAFLEIPLDTELRDLQALQGGLKSALAAIKTTLTAEGTKRGRVIRHDFQPDSQKQLARKDRPKP